MSAIAKVSHQGVVHFGALKAEAVVLEDGRRGFLSKQLAQMLGYTEKTRSGRFDRFLSEFSPNFMKGKEKAGWPVLNAAGGGRAQFVPAEAVMEAVGNVLRAAIAGKTHRQQAKQVSACVEISLALGTVGLTALIDEATGYQHHRAPDALQDLIGRLIRKSVADWDRRFEPEYYQALAKVTNTRWNSGSKGRPAIWGAITRKWVYEVCFPQEILAALDCKQEGHEKLHQWLTDGGVGILEKQIEAVRLIASCSVNHKHFDAQCSMAFNRKGQIGMVYPEAA